MDEWAGEVHQPTAEAKRPAGGDALDEKVVTLW